jgi:release factor glutamine methyltransferase
MNITLGQIKTELLEALHQYYPSQEIHNFYMMLAEHILKLPSHKVLAYPETNVENSEYLKLQNAIEDLKKFRPIQHIIGKTEFYDLEFIVNQNVLVPRPETEELVHLIIENQKGKACKIMDIGTGTGCIPITLAKNINGATVHAIDVSVNALETARENAKLNGANVVFHHMDILSTSALPSAPFDVIVSNPPYVMEKEKQQMQTNVLEYDPHLALFVPNNNPLLFYIAISKLASKSLVGGGFLYFEINEALGKETKTMMEEIGFSNVKVIRDLYGKDRIIQAQWFFNKPTIKTIH